MPDPNNIVDRAVGALASLERDGEWPFVARARIQQAIDEATAHFRNQVASLKAVLVLEQGHSAQENDANSKLRQQLAECKGKTLREAADLGIGCAVTGRSLEQLADKLRRMGEQVEREASNGAE